MPRTIGHNYYILIILLILYMHIVDSHEFFELYRGDKDFRLGIELCKHSDTKYTALVPDVSSPGDASFFNTKQYPKDKVPELPEGMNIEYIKSWLIYFRKDRLTHGGFFQFSSEYISSIKKLKPDLIFENPYTTLTPRSYMTYYAAKINNVPIVYVDPADIPPKGPIKQFLNRIESKIINYASAIITYNQLGKDRFVNEYGYPENRVHVIPKPVDINQFRPDVGREETRKSLDIENKFVVSYIGRLSSNKGCFQLMEAAYLLRERGLAKDFFFIFAGGNISSADAKHVQRLREKYDLQNVHFTGPVSHDQMCHYQAASDVIAYPIHNNPPGFSTVLAESMAMGKAIIVGNRDCEDATPIKNGVNGITIESGNVNELVDAILELKGNVKLRNVFEHAVRKYAEENMAWSRQAKIYREIFERAIER